MIPGSAGVDVLGGLADVERVFLSFPEVTDPARHGDYNAWHQLDHLPQNRALPGVRHGERWVRTPACREASVLGDDPLAAELDAAHYVASYWFATPSRASVAEWFRLGEQTGEVGRRPDLAWTERRFTGFFRPVANCADDVLVTAGAVPFLPHAGIVVEVEREPADGATQVAEQHARQPGALGAWVLAGRGSSAGLRVSVTWCADDPAAVCAARPESGDGLVLRTGLEIITPGRWDWFDR